MTRRWAVLGALAAALAALVPVSTAAAASPYQLGYLHVGARSGPAALPQVLDEGNRVVLLRGVNVNGLEDYYADSSTPLAIPYPSSPAAYAGGACPARNPAVESMALCEFDLAQLRALGYDSIRLAVSWSLLEPQPGHVDTTYIDRIAQVVGWARAAGIYVVIDMHQDAWSKYLYTASGQLCPPPFKAVGGSHEADGAPAWASTAVTPTCALNGTRELDTAVQEDFQKFWSDFAGPDGTGLQEHYASVVLALARRFHADPTVAGYELMNEPSPGLFAPVAMDPVKLFPFYAKVVSTLTTGIPGFRQLVFVEPDITRDITDHSFVLTPWSAFSTYPNVVYAPHVYTRIFTPDQALNTQLVDPLFPLDGGYKSAVVDAAALGLPLWVGEFGNDVPDDETILRAHYTYADGDTIGSSLWVWKADARANFSVYHGPFGAGTPFPSRVKFTSRAYPLFTAGTLDSVAFTPGDGSFAIHASSSIVRCADPGRATVIFVPAVYAGAVTATGAALESFAVPGGRLVLAFPTGGAYSVSSGPATATPDAVCIGDRGPVTIATGTPTTATADPVLGLPERVPAALAILGLACVAVLTRRWIGDHE